MGDCVSQIIAFPAALEKSGSALIVGPGRSYCPQHGLAPVVSPGATVRAATGLSVPGPGDRFAVP